MIEMSKLKKLCLLLGVSFLSFTGFLDATIVSTALPDIQSRLGMSVTQLQWIMNAFFLGVSAFMASMGRLGDLYGRRRIFYIGTLIFALASVGAGCATVPWFLIVCRALQGIATAITIPVGVALIQATHDKTELAKAMSIFGSITGAGLAIGPVAGGLLVTAFGWPAVFFVNIPFVVFGFLLCLVSIHESRSQATMTLDYFGIVFLALTIASLVFGMMEANSVGWGASSVVTSFVITALSLGILIFIERTVSNPIMAGYLFRNRVFMPTMLFSFVGGGAMSVVLFIDPLYLHSIFNESNVLTGVMLFIIPLAVVISAYLIGHIHHFFGSRLLMILASIAYLAMSILHMMLGITLAYTVIVPAFILMGLGWGVVNTVPGTALGETLHADHIGVAIGALFSFFNIGAAVLLALSVVIFHAQATHSVMLQFAAHHVQFNAADYAYLHQFISQPDQLASIAPHLGMDPLLATKMLKHAFVVAMHHMYWPIAILSVVAWLGLVFIMQKKSS